MAEGCPAISRGGKCVKQTRDFDAGYRNFQQAVQQKHLARSVLEKLLSQVAVYTRNFDCFGAWTASSGGVALWMCLCDNFQCLVNR